MVQQWCHTKSLHYKVLCGSFDRVTDTIWFNNEMSAGSATSAFQSHTHPIPPPVPRYRQWICLERSTLIHNKQQFFTSLCISGDNYHITLSLASFPGPTQLSVTCRLLCHARPRLLCHSPPVMSHIIILPGSPLSFNFSIANKRAWERGYYVTWLFNSLYVELCITYTVVSHLLWTQFSAILTLQKWDCKAPKVSQWPKSAVMLMSSSFLGGALL